jgi:hypothetical protein
VLNDLITAGLVIAVSTDRRKDDSFINKVPLGDFIPTTILERLSNIGDSGYRSPDAEDEEQLLADLWAAAEASPQNAPLVVFKPDVAAEADSAATAKA